MPIAYEKLASIRFAGEPGHSSSPTSVGVGLHGHQLGLYRRTQHEGFRSENLAASARAFVRLQRGRILSRRLLSMFRVQALTTCSARGVQRQRVHGSGAELPWKMKRCVPKPLPACHDAPLPDPLLFRRRRWIENARKAAARLGEC